MTPKRLALLSYLVIARPRGLHQRDMLLALFWPELDARHARNALSQAIHGLRRALPQDALVSHGHSGIGLAEGVLECDAIAFEHAVVADRPAEGLELYQGELLDGLYVRDAAGFERWLDRERVRFRRMARDAARRQADAELRAGDAGAAIRWLRRGLDIVPTDETLVQTLVTVQDAIGDRAGAVATFEQFERFLRTDYALEPAPETKALADAVRSRSFASTLPAPVEISSAGDQHTGAAPAPGLAVLPFANLTGDPAREYFADGFTETLITELARSSGLRTISRQSVLTFKNSRRPLTEIAGRLGVDLLVEGSVLRAGNRIRIAVQLLRAEPEQHLWADAFDGDMKDVYTLQRTVAEAIRREAARSFGLKFGEPPARTYTVDPDAFDEFLRGVVRLPYATAANFREVVGHFERAADRDPGFADAHAWIALAWTGFTYLGACSFEDGRARVMPAIAAALKLGSELGSVRAIHATVLQAFVRDWAAVESECRRALELGGGDVRSYVPNVTHITAMGRFHEAIARASEAIRLNPLGGPEQFWLGWVLFRAGRYDAAVEQLHWARAQWPDLTYVTAFLAASQLFAGWPEQAIETCRQALSLPQPPTGLAYIAATLARAGASAEAAELVDRLRGIDRAAYLDPYTLAVACAGLGDVRAMLAALERVVDEGSVQSWVLAVDIFFDPYRDHPGVKRVVRALQLPDVHATS